MSTPSHTDTTATSPVTPGLTRAELAERLGRSVWWVGDQVRRGLVPHIRKGAPPPVGARDTRPVYFTPEHVAQIEARVNHLEEYAPTTAGVA